MIPVIRSLSHLDLDLDLALLGHGDTSDKEAPAKLESTYGGFRGWSVKSIVCGDYHTACTTGGGELWTWGRGDRGGLTLFRHVIHSEPEAPESRIQVN